MVGCFCMLQNLSLGSRKPIAEMCAFPALTLVLARAVAILSTCTALTGLYLLHSKAPDPSDVVCNWAAMQLSGAVAAACRGGQASQVSHVRSKLLRSSSASDISVLYVQRLLQQAPASAPTASSCSTGTSPFKACIGYMSSSNPAAFAKVVCMHMRFMMRKERTVLLSMIKENFMVDLSVPKPILHSNLKAQPCHANSWCSHLLCPGKVGNWLSLCIQLNLLQPLAMSR